MVCISSRVVLTACVLTGLASGCAHGGKASDGSTSPPPDRRSIVTSEDLERTPVESIERTLMSKVPGVWVSHTADGTLTIRIRGATSLSGSSEPLYVIDGIPIQPGPEGSLAGINPYDIASIEVLKDAAATSVFGLRGANGVIIIKTKNTGH